MSHTAVTPFSAADVIEEIEETKNAEPMAVTPNEQFTLLILLILLILLTLEDQYEYLVPGTHPRLFVEVARSSEQLYYSLYESATRCILQQ